MGYIAIETNKRDNTIRFVNKDKKIADRKYQLLHNDFNDKLYKVLFSKIQETEYTEIELNDESYSIPNFKFISKSSEDYIVSTTLLDYALLVSFASKEICTSCKYIHYKLDPKNNIVSFTNRKGKISTYKMSYSDIVELRTWLTLQQAFFSLEAKNGKLVKFTYRYLDGKKIAKYVENRMKKRDYEDQMEVIQYIKNNIRDFLNLDLEINEGTI